MALPCGALPAALVQNEASKLRTHLEWKYDPVLQSR